MRTARSRSSFEYCFAVPINSILSQVEVFRESRRGSMRPLGLLIGLRVKRKRNNDSRFLKHVPRTIATQNADDHYLETRITIVAICIGKDRFCLRADPLFRSCASQVAPRSTLFPINHPAVRRVAKQCANSNFRSDILRRLRHHLAVRQCRCDKVFRFVFCRSRGTQKRKEEHGD